MGVINSNNNINNNNIKIINLNDYKKEKEHETINVNTKLNIVENTADENVHYNIKPLATEDIDKLKEYILNKPMRYKNSNVNIRNYTMVVVGMNIGKRIEDLLELQVKNVINSNGELKDSYTINEKKTSKQSTIYFNSSCKEAIKMLLETKENWNGEDYLFQSSKGTGRITRQQAWRIMKDAQESLNLDYNIGTHTLRKTWATQALIKNKDDVFAMNEVQQVLNHSDIKTTMIYTKQNEVRTKEFMESVCL